MGSGDEAQKAKLDGALNSNKASVDLDQANPRGKYSIALREEQKITTCAARLVDGSDWFQTEAQAG